MWASARFRSEDQPFPVVMAMLGFFRMIENQHGGIRLARFLGLGAVGTACVLTVGCEKLKSLTSKTPAVPASPLTGAVCRELKEADYPGFIATPGRLSVVVYHATWCGPCKQLAPVLEKVSAEFGEVAQVGRFDVDQCRTLCAQQGVNGIPDVRFFLNGKQVDSFIGGARESDVREKFQAYTHGLIPAKSGGSAEGGANGGKPEPTIQPMPKGWMPPGMKKL